MITIGIDPDTKATGIAVVEDGKVIRVATATVPAKWDIDKRTRAMVKRLHEVLTELKAHVPHLDRAVVEGQMVYPRERTRPNDLIPLAQIAGAAEAYIGLLWNVDVIAPKPRDWKGQVPKDVHQRRILARVGLTNGLDGVPGAESMTRTQRGHVVDAVGLALWGAELKLRTAV
ncbi:MAG: hypothetical protein AAF682_32050 [Planctomycetota bacterium]